MSDSRECARIRENINRLNRERPIAHQEYVDLQNRSTQIPKEIDRLRGDLATLIAADRISGAGTGLAVRHPAAWVIVQALRAGTLGSAIMEVRNTIRAKEQELREVNRQVPLARDRWMAMNEQLAAGADAFNDKCSDG